MSKQIVSKVADLITSAFGLVAALAWNSAIQDWFANQERLAAGGQWMYALIVTVIAVLATIWIGRIADRVIGDENVSDG